MAWPWCSLTPLQQQQQQQMMLPLPSLSKATSNPSSPGVGGWTGASTHRARGSSCPHSAGKHPVPAPSTISLCSEGICLAPAGSGTSQVSGELLGQEPWGAALEPASCRMRCQLLSGRSDGFKHPSVPGETSQPGHQHVSRLLPPASQGLPAMVVSMPRSAFTVVLLSSTAR